MLGINHLGRFVDDHGDDHEVEKISNKGDSVRDHDISHQVVFSVRLIVLKKDLDTLENPCSCPDNEA